MKIKQFLIAAVLMLALSNTQPALSDNVEQLVDLFRIAEELEAQHKECMAGSVDSVESDLRLELEAENIDIQPGDEDWALLIAIYSEYYTALCSYLAGDEILDFYKAEFRKRFTSDEIDQLIEFHKTPIGMKFSEQQFEISRVFGDIHNERQAVDAHEAQKLFNRRLEDFWNYRADKFNNESRDQDV